MRGVCDYVSELGYIDSSNATVKNTKKTVKKCFKKHLQRKMMISMNDVIIESFDNINDFVRSYYIESPKVRAMKVKAHMIIKKLFVFFMEHEEMLPIEYQQRMEYCTQSLLETKYNDEKDPSGANGHHLAFQYLQERYLEHQWQHNKRDRKASASHVHLSDIIRFLNSQPEKINLPKILTELIHNWETDSKNWDTESKAKDAYDKIHSELCHHITKARVVVDYIACMTDRMAEKKYNEIVSSSTTWSTSYHE